MTENTHIEIKCREDIGKYLFRLIDSATHQGLKGSELAIEAAGAINAAFQAKNEKAAVQIKMVDTDTKEAS